MKNFKLPRFIRHTLAFIRVMHSSEIGGVLHDYANGRWLELHKWDTQEGCEEALGLVCDMTNNVRDNIYIAMIKCDLGKGYFVIHDSNGDQYTRAFWLGIYNPDEALTDVAKRCRMLADKMGYRRPE